MPAVPQPDFVGVSVTFETPFPDTNYYYAVCPLADTWGALTIFQDGTTGLSIYRKCVRAENYTLQVRWVAWSD